MLTNARVLMKHCFTENVYRSDIFQPSNGHQVVKYIHYRARSTKCSYGCSVTHYTLLTKALHTTRCSLKRYTLHAAHESVTHYTLLTKALHTTRCSPKRYTLHAAHESVTHYTLLTKLHFMVGSSFGRPCCSNVSISILVWLLAGCSDACSVNRVLF
jgi:hypothetical protein